MIECSKLTQYLNKLEAPIPFRFDEYVTVRRSSNLLVQSHEQLASTQIYGTPATVIPETPQDWDEEEYADRSGSESDSDSTSGEQTTLSTAPRQFYVDPHKNVKFVHQTWLPRNCTPLNDSYPCRQKSWYTGGPPYTIGGRMEWVDSHQHKLKHYVLDLQTGEARVEKQWDFREFTELFVHPQDRPLMISPEGDIVAEILYNDAYLVNFTKGWYYYFLDGHLHRVRGQERQSSKAPVEDGKIESHGTNGIHVWPMSDRFMLIKLEGGSMWCVHLVDWDTGRWHFMMESEDNRVAILYPSYSGIIYVHGRNDDLVGLMPRFNEDCSEITWYEISRSFGMQNTHSYYSLLFDFNYVPDTLLGRFAWGLDRIVDFDRVKADVAQGDSYAMLRNDDDGQVYCYVFLYHFTARAIKEVRDALMDKDTTKLDIDTFRA